MTIRQGLAAALLCLGGMGQAGELTAVTDAGAGCALRLTGTIEDGDAAALEAFADTGGRLCLDSEGGGLAAAVALAETVTRLGLGTGVEDGARCLGACGLVFLAGTRASGEADRMLYPGARLEIGLPALPDSDDSAGAHADVLRALGRYWALRLAGLDLPDSVFTSLLATPPGQGLAVHSIGQAARWRITVPDVAAPGDDVGQALSHACGTVAAGLRDLRPEDSARAGRRLDFSYADFDADGAIARGGDCTVALLLDGGTPGGRVETGPGALPLSAALLYPPQTRLADLPRMAGGETDTFLAALAENAREALAEVDFRSCWLTAPEARVVNVEDYVNLRASAGFGAEIRRRVPLGERLTIVGVQSLLTPGDAGQARRCLDDCNALALSPDDPELRGRVGGCIRSNVFWYEVRDAARSEGFVSRKFLAP